MKYRSLIDYKEIYECDKEGYNLGLDASIFIRRETVQRVFERPRIGTQGSSIGAAAASTDISAGSDNALDVAVDGGALVNVLLNLVGANTGAAIASELETAINNALIAAGQDARVWVQFDGGDDHYEIYSQSTGLTSSVVVTDAGADNVADDLNLGTANGGTESAGTDDQDFLLYTTGGPTLEQPIESNRRSVLQDSFARLGSFLSSTVPCAAGMFASLMMASDCCLQRSAQEVFQTNQSVVEFCFCISFFLVFLCILQVKKDHGGV